MDADPVDAEEHDADAEPHADQLPDGDGGDADEDPALMSSCFGTREEGATDELDPDPADTEGAVNRETTAAQTTRRTC